MGFHLWLDGDRAWAQGTYEYRPMGTAIIARSDLFQHRDFTPRRRPPRSAEYLGQFASLGHINAVLRERLRRGRGRRRVSERRS